MGLRYSTLLLLQSENTGKSGYKVFVGLGVFLGLFFFPFLVGWLFGFLLLLFGFFC